MKGYGYRIGSWGYWRHFIGLTRWDSLVETWRCFRIRRRRVTRA